MKRRPLLLDLFCGAGGCAVGYHRAGFDVVGVDNRLQPNYPFEFVCADAFLFLWAQGRRFDAIHASPPCQGYSSLSFLPHIKGKDYPKLIEETRSALEESGRPWVIENVERAPLGGVVLCGAMFGLRVYRHRRFESFVQLTAPEHPKHLHGVGSVTAYAVAGKPNRPNRNYYADPNTGFVSVAGHNFRREAAEKAMGIDWMPRREDLAQAIPPAYTEYVGRQLRKKI